jgi:hypothetical protein
MKEKNKVSLKHNFFDEKTILERFEEKLKFSMFNVLFVLLKSEESNFWMEMVSLLSELFQFMFYPFTFNVSIKFYLYTVR